MLHRIVVILALVCAGSAVVAADMIAPRPLDSAMSAMRRGDWDRAVELAKREGPAAVSLIEWFRLSGGGEPDAVQRFAEQHPDWPGLDTMRRRAESKLEGRPASEIIEYFREQPPQTGAGVLLYADALIKTGERGEAEASLVLAWRTKDLTEADNRKFIKEHGKVLAPHHEARFDMALWRNLRNDLAVLRPIVSAGQRALADAREGLQNRTKNVDALIEAVPKDLQKNGGLAYDRFNWRLKKGLGEQAIDLMLEQSKIPGGLGMPERWASWRRSLARSEMRAGRVQQAYDLASTHQLVDGSNFADLEWLSGYISLRKLDNPERALEHFKRFREAVFTPISIGRAGYWLGKTYEALGQPEDAKTAYLEAAGHQTSFYGLLAAEEAGIPFDESLAGTEYFPAWQNASFAGGHMAEIIGLAIAMDDLTLAEKFVTALADTLDRKGMGQLGNMLADLDAPHLGVMLGKAAARREIVLPAAYYALHPLHERNLSIAPEMALAIARRESEFDPRVVSGVGAQGLMQLMPATAREVARDLSITHRPADVLADWRYNATLGSAYLAGLARTFDGNVIMMSAGYNAGPGRPKRWMRDYGDPRKGEIDIVDWIEHIPFRETQNYVMRVSESLPIYRARLGKTALPIPFSKELVGSTLLPLSP